MAPKQCKCIDGVSFKEECCLVSKILGAPKLNKSTSSGPIKSSLRKVERASRKLLQKAIEQSTLKDLDADALVKATDEIKKQVHKKMENTLDIVSIVSDLYRDDKEDSSKNNNNNTYTVKGSPNPMSEDDNTFEIVKEVLKIVGVITVICSILYTRHKLSEDIAKYIIMKRRNDKSRVESLQKHHIIQYCKQYMWETIAVTGPTNSFSTIVDQFISFIVDELISKIPLIGPTLASAINMIVRAMKSLIQFIIEITSVTLEKTWLVMFFFILVDHHWIEHHINSWVISDSKHTHNDSNVKGNVDSTTIPTVYTVVASPEYSEESKSLTAILSRALSSHFKTPIAVCDATDLSVGQLLSNGLCQMESLASVHDDGISQPHISKSAMSMSNGTPIILFLQAVSTVRIDGMWNRSEYNKLQNMGQF